jgi:hypothetical protein
MFCDAGLTDMLRVVVPDKSFQLTDYW